MLVLETQWIESAVFASLPLSLAPSPITLVPLVSLCGNAFENLPSLCPPASSVSLESLSNSRKSAEQLEGWAFIGPPRLLGQWRQSRRGSGRDKATRVRGRGAYLGGGRLIGGDGGRNTAKTLSAICRAADAAALCAATSARNNAAVTAPHPYRATADYPFQYLR